jgi:hypothetical protein
MKSAHRARLFPIAHWTSLLLAVTSASARLLARVPQLPEVERQAAERAATASKQGGCAKHAQADQALCQTFRARASRRPHWHTRIWVDYQVALHSEAE